MSENSFSSLNRSKQTMPFSFGGSASEYFGIWIVNLLLTIVTLGIYSAWAKVRRLRYFYGNTWLNGHNFEYHAKPSQILVGRIIVLIVLIVFTVVNNFFPAYSFLIFFAYLIALPWLINQSMRFNSRMTSYRNVRLGFKGTYLRSLWVFVILPFAPIFIAAITALIASSGIEWKDYPDGKGNMIALPTEEYLIIFAIMLGIAILVQLVILPFISRASNQYIGNNLSFGSASFSTQMGIEQLYKHYLLIVACVLGPVLLVALFVYLSTSSGNFILILAGGLGQIIAIAIYILFLVAPIAYAAGVRNIAFNGSILDGKHQMASYVSRKGYAWIILSNLFLISITIGLMRPWAATRTWNYLAENTTVNIDGNMNDIIASQKDKGNVVASEYLDIDGIEIGL